MVKFQRGQSTRSFRTKLLTMPATKLGPDTYITARYDLKSEGGFELWLESDIPVKTYIVRPKGLEFFKKGSASFKYYGGFPDPRRTQEQEVWLPRAGTWYLIISNPSKRNWADIEYEVSF